MMRQPYSLRQAAALIGMSPHWLRRRLGTRELKGVAFRTSGKSGHWRLAADAFDQWAALWASGSKREPVTRRPRQRRTRAARLSFGTSGAADIMAALRGA